MFLKFANFYRQFIWEFSRIVEGLTSILKGSLKEKFQSIKVTLTKDAEVSFYQLFSAFTTSLMLCHFDPFLFIKIKTDASGFAILRILSQK